jgi:ribosome-associated protein
LKEHPGLDRRETARRKRTAPPAAPELARTIAEHALGRKAEEILVIDLRGLSPVCDFFVVCHGESDVQVKAIADAIIEGLAETGNRAWHVEGYTGRSWILIDYVDVVVHVFHRETRHYYRLEDLWGDAPRELVRDGTGDA